MMHTRLLGRGAIVLAMLLLCVLGGSRAGAQTIIYVNAAAAAGGNGQSWGTAFNDLQAGLASAAAIPGAPRNIEIWVSAGVYRPGPAGASTTSSFSITSDVRVYGGFAGNEARRAQRNVRLNPTILSGDLSGDDADGFGALGDNCTRVVTIDNRTGVRLDGFIIEGGAFAEGAGIYSNGSNTTVFGCVIRRNYNSTAAGMLCENGGTVSVVNCVFDRNGRDGGSGTGGNGLFAYETASVTAVNCTFSRNVANRGAAVGLNRATLRLQNCIAYGNSTTNGGPLEAFAGPSPIQVSSSCIEGGSSANGNISANPAFRDPSSGDFRLQASSPCIDIGSGSFVASADKVDLDWNRRIFDAPGIQGTDVDMGAYEFGAPPVPGTMYVRPGGSAANSGASWSSAKSDLAAAIVEAGQQTDYTSDVWVARGVYRPTSPGGSRSSSFQLQNKLVIYGGFAGTEAALSERPPLPTNATDALNPTWATVLSGDLNGDDIGDINRGDNSYHVVRCSNTEYSAVLNGLTITAGNATGPVINDLYGAGVLLDPGRATIQSCTLVGNRAFGSTGANGEGAAIYATQGSGLRLQNSLIAMNRAAIAGGIVVQPGTHELRDCRFEENSDVALAGALYVAAANADLVNCTFLRNSSTNGQGAAASQGASTIRVINSAFLGNATNRSTGAVGINPGATASFVNSVFCGNRGGPIGGSNGAIDADQSAVTLTNCVFAANESDPSTASVRAITGPLTAVNCLWWQNRSGGPPTQQSQILLLNGATLAISHSTVDGWNGSFAGVGNDGLDPLFVRTPSAGTDGVWGTNDDDYGDLRLSAGSPAIDSGNSVALPPDSLDVDRDSNITEALPVDLAGFPRFVDDPAVTNTGPGSAPHVDRGTYEAQVNCLTCPGPREWRSAIGGVFDFPSNWFPSVPNSTHDTLFNLNSTYTVSMPPSMPAASLAANSALFRQGNVSFNLSGGALSLLAVANPSLTVGDAALTTAQLTLTNSIFNTVDTRIGSAPGSLGVVNVGSGAQLNSTRSLTVGFQGSGVLNIASGGRVFTRDATVGDQATSAGFAQVTGPGSRWDIPFFLVINNGEVNVSNGGTLSAGFGIFLFNDGVITGDGTISGPVVNFGRIQPGNSPGTLTINGSYQQIGAIPGLGDTAGSLVTEINGTSASAFDKLRVTGAATLGGGLYVSLGSGFVPGPSDSFELLRSDVGISRTFDVIFFQALSGPNQARFLRANYSGFRGTTGGAVRIGTGNLPINPGFAAPLPFDLPGDPGAASIGDINLDGIPDMVVALPAAGNANGSVAVLTGVGPPGSSWGGLTLAATLPVGRRPSAVVLSDLDTDGRLDIIVANADDDTITVLRQLSSAGTFEPPVTIGVGTQAFSTEPVSVAVMRVDVDTRPDIVVANRGGEGESGGVTILRSSSTPGTISFSAGDRREIPAPPRRKPTSVNPFDPDQDKDVDLAVSATSPAGFVGEEDAGEVMVFINGSGIAPPPGSGLLTYPPLLSLTEPTLRLSIPGGAVQVVSARLLPSPTQRLADLVAVSVEDNSVSVLANRTAGNPGTANDQTVAFAPPVTYTLPGGPGALAAARSAALVDMDSDNDPDLAVLVADADGASREVYVLRNDSLLAAGTSPDQIAFAQLPDAFQAAPAGVSPRAILAGDLDQDSRRDLVSIGLSQSPGTGSLNVLRNTLPSPALSLGACCRGASCSLVPIGDCVGPGVRFISVNAPCNALGDYRTPCCKADASQDGVRNVQDIFVFLSLWFADGAGSDADDSGVRNVADIFVFLSAWFAGC